MSKINSINFIYSELDTYEDINTPVYIQGKTPYGIDANIKLDSVDILQRYPLSHLQFFLYIGDSATPEYVSVDSSRIYDLPYEGTISFRIDNVHSDFTYSSDILFRIDCVITNSVSQTQEVTIGSVSKKPINKVSFYNNNENRFIPGLMRTYHNGEWIYGQVKSI